MRKNRRTARETVLDRKALVKSSCFGMMWYLWIATLILPAYGDSFSTDPLLTHGLLLIACVIIIAAYGIATAKGKQFFKKRWPLLLAATLLSLSILFNVAGINRLFPIPNSILFLFCVGFGVGLGMFACFQIDFLGELSPNELQPSLLVSIGVGVALLAPMQILHSENPFIFGLVESLLTYLIVPFLHIKGSREKAAASAWNSEPQAPHTFSRIIPSLASSGLFLGFFVGNLPNGGNDIATTSILAFAVLIVIVFASRFSREAPPAPRLVFAAKIISLFGIIGVVLFLAYPSFDSIWLGIVAADFISFLLIMLLLCATTPFAPSISDSRPALARILVISTIGVVAGLLTRYALGISFDDYFRVACLVVISVLAAAATLLLDGKKPDSERKDESKKAEMAIAALVFSSNNDFAGDEIRSYCNAIAIEYGLTAKQAEVLVYLAFGRTAKSIAKSLGNSEGTIRGHINQIYMKLHVHSKDELEAFLRDQFIRRQQ